MSDSIFNPKDEIRPDTSGSNQPLKKVVKDSPKISGKQKKLARYIKEFLQCDYSFEQTWDWLKSDKGYNLFVDIYFPDYKLCVQYHGYQHFTYPNHFHKNRKQFLDQRKRDRRKVSLLKDKGLKVLLWPYKFTISKQRVKSRLDKLNIGQ